MAYALAVLLRGQHPCPMAFQGALCRQHVCLMLGVGRAGISVAVRIEGGAWILSHWFQGVEAGRGEGCANFGGRQGAELAAPAAGIALGQQCVDRPRRVGVWSLPRRVRWAAVYLDGCSSATAGIWLALIGLGSMRDCTESGRG